MKEKKAITKKIDESTLRNIIYKKVLKELNLKEWRGEFGNFGYDGDVRYVRPNGEPNSPSTGLDVYHPYNNGKRTKGTARLKHEDGTDYSVGILEPNILAHGKAKLISKTMEAIDEILLGNKKIEWTDSEMEDIRNIKAALYELAIKTKEEGNEKRGYNGPEEESDEEEINEGLWDFLKNNATMNRKPGQLNTDQIEIVLNSTKNINEKSKRDFFRCIGDGCVVIGVRKNPEYSSMAGKCEYVMLNPNGSIYGHFKRVPGGFEFIFGRAV